MANYNIYDLPPTIEMEPRGKLNSPKTSVHSFDQDTPEGSLSSKKAEKFGKSVSPSDENAKTDCGVACMLFILSVLLSICIAAIVYGGLLFLKMKADMDTIKLDLSAAQKSIDMVHNDSTLVNQALEKLKHNLTEFQNQTMMQSAQIQELRLKSNETTQINVSVSVGWNQEFRNSSCVNSTFTENNCTASETVCNCKNECDETTLKDQTKVIRGDNTYMIDVRSCSAVTQLCNHSSTGNDTNATTYTTINYFTLTPYVCVTVK